MAELKPAELVEMSEDDALLFEMIPGAVAEVDPQQIAILRTLTPAQRFQQMLSMIDLVEGIAAYRLRQRQPELTDADALRIVRTRHADL